MRTLAGFLSLGLGLAGAPLMGCSDDGTASDTKTGDDGEKSSKDGDDDDGKKDRDDDETPTGQTGTEEEALALISQFVEPGADYLALTQALRPTAEDYRAYFLPSALDQAQEAYEEAWKNNALTITRAGDETEVLLWSATTEQLINEPAGHMLKSDAKHFPGGYGRAAKVMQKGLTIYRFKFVKPGETIGMGYDGLVFLNDHWVIFPKPWYVTQNGRSADEMTAMFEDMSPHDMRAMMEE